jgi:hypothetical protein
VTDGVGDDFAHDQPEVRQPGLTDEIHSYGAEPRSGLPNRSGLGDHLDLSPSWHLQRRHQREGYTRAGCTVRRFVDLLTREIASYASIFGSLATIVVLIGYLYASSVIFLGGVQVDALHREQA